LYETDKKEEGIKTLTKALAYVNYKPSIFDERARMYSEMENFDLAINDFTQQINLCNDKKHCDYRSRGLTYLRMNQQEKAIADFSLQMKYSPEPFDYISRAKAYKALWKFKAAEADIAKARKMSTATGLEDF